MTHGVVTHYTLSLHPRNPALVHVTRKDTGKVAFHKIRHQVAGNYAINLVDSDTFAVCAETQSKSATDRKRTIVLCQPNASSNIQVIFQETSRLGFEWCFEWQGDMYRWTRESRMSNALECRYIRSSGDNVRVAQYLPRGIKNEYFGLFSLLDYNMVDVQDCRGLELVLFMTILIMLDKADEGGWMGGLVSKKNKKLNTCSLAMDDKKWKLERENDQKLQAMLDKEARRNSSSSSRRQPSIIYDENTSSTHRNPHASINTTTQKQEDPCAQFAEMVRYLDATATLRLSMPPSRNKNYTCLEDLFLQEQQPMVPQRVPPPPPLLNQQQQQHRRPTAPRRVSAGDYRQQYPFLYRSPQHPEQNYHHMSNQ